MVFSRAVQTIAFMFVRARQVVSADGGKHMRACPRSRTSTGARTLTHSASRAAGLAEESASAMQLLLTNQHITGQVLAVDGGLSRLK